MQTGKMSICLVALLGMAVLSPARAGTGKDCAPMGALPNYRASAAPERYGFQSHGFLAMQKDGSNERTRIAGRYRSEEHTSELQSLMRISYAVFCLKKKKDNRQSNKTHTDIQPQIRQKYNAKIH